MGIKLKYACARLQKAKGEVNVLVSDTISFRRTFKEHLDEEKKLMERWKGKLPVWAWNQLIGYVEAVSSTTLYHAPITKALATAHLYKGMLYWKYKQWRNAWPDTDAGELTDTCCSVWGNKLMVVGLGEQLQYKVFHKNITVERSEEHPHGYKEDEEAVGKWFPAVSEWKGER